ncbi:MAG TPA: efflux RND transporter periplasmic adaptor subunit [Alphaproteobacteria bacterium]
MRRGPIIGAALLLAGLSGGAVAVIHSLGARAKAPTSTTVVSEPVVAQTVKSGDVPIFFSGIGFVQAYNTVVVRSQIQGQLTQIAFTEGQSVHPGDLLAQIDPRPYQAQLDQATANRDRDRAQLANAQANLQRYLPLLARGFATPQLVDTQKAQVAQLAASVKSDEAVIESAKVQLDYTRMTAPIEGVTGIRQLDIGNVIHPTDPNGLVVVTQLHPISVIFTLPEADLPQIQQQMAKGPLTVLAYSQDDKIKLDEGTLELVNNEIIQTSGSIQLKVRFPNLANRLWPGELVNLRLLIETRHDGLTVAAPAVQRNPQGAYVYVVNSDKTVDSRAITVEQVSNGQVLVETGLTAGEQVVVDGQSRLQPGSHVTLLEGRAAEEVASQSAQQADIP